MSEQEAFGRMCQRVCEEQGWKLLPSGVEVPCEGTRRQLVSLEFFEHEDEELVRLYTVIGSVEQINSMRLGMALRLNFGLPHGALAVRGEELVMVDTLMLEDADSAEVEAAISYMARTADYYERTIYGTDEH
jgi:hypothetical protein